MEQEKIQTLGCDRVNSIFVVNGVSGCETDKTSWLVAAYSSETGAERVRTYLQNLADAVGNAHPGHEGIHLRALKDVDPKAWFDEYIYYTVEEIKYVN